MALLSEPLGSDFPAGGAFVGRIPIRNLWLLMFYASDLFRERGRSDVSVEDNPDDLPDLAGEMLAHAVEVRMRRQLSHGFLPRRRVVNRVRGRIDVLSTERHQWLARGRVACRFDELTIDTPRNRYVRAALETVARIATRPEVVHRCRGLAGGMKEMGVSGIVPSRAEIGLERFGRNDEQDRLMMAAARLVLDLALPTESSGLEALWLPEREEVWVRRLFERAVGGFYEVVLGPQEWRVARGKTLTWSISDKTDGIEAILPSMKTDIVLDRLITTWRVVIDTKFTSIVTKGWHRARTLRSEYVYQLYSYLRSQDDADDPLAAGACGMLLHPAIGEDVDESVAIQGHRLRFATIDLAGPASKIRARLLSLCDESGWIPPGKLPAAAAAVANAMTS